MGVAGNLYGRGKWNQGKSTNSDGHNAFKMTKKDEYMYFYAGPLSDSLPKGWQEDDNSHVYSVVNTVDANGDPETYGGSIEIYAKTSGVVWGKIVMLNNDGDVSFQHDLHAPASYDQTVELGHGATIYIKRSD